MQPSDVTAQAGARANATVYGHEKLWTVLSWLGQRLNVAPTPFDAASIIMEAADELFGWDAATLDLYDADTDLVTALLTMDTIDGVRTKCDPSPFGNPSPRARKVLDEGAQIMLRKADNEAEGTYRFGDKSRPSKSLMYVPVRLGPKIIGIMSVQSYTVNAYAKADLNLLQFFADFAAGALNRIWAEQKRKVAEDRLAEQAALLELTPDAVMVCSLDGKIMYWNKGAERMFGWGRREAVGMNMIQMHKSEENFRNLVELVLKHERHSGEVTKVRKDGRELIVQTRGTVILDGDQRPKAVLITNTDITNQKKLEAQMLRAQRMESIGTLAGGIAHDLNNVLAPILMSVQILRDRATSAHDRALLDTVENSSQRGADLVRQLLTFGRGMEGKRVAVNVRHLAKEIDKIVGDTFPKNIEFKLQAPKDIWTIEADPTHIHQVLVNLCVNARDAMPEGGRLAIELSNVTVDDSYAKMHPDAKAGPYVAISVEDTGFGMSTELQEKIFDPFFTTKELGKGTGLGLATVMTIVNGYQGFINVYSELNKGSRFKVFFPAKPSTAAVAQAVVDNGALPQGNGELILVIDDEENIRSITTQTLECFGYRTLAAANGAEAIAIYAQRKDEIALVLTDMMMPVMDGPATIIALRAINAHVKVIGSSGLAAKDVVNGVTGAALQDFVPKPYTAERLLKVLRRVLSDETAA